MIMKEGLVLGIDFTKKKKNIEEEMRKVKYGKRNETNAVGKKAKQNKTKQNNSFQSKLDRGKNNSEVNLASQSQEGYDMSAQAF